MRLILTQLSKSHNVLHCRLRGDQILNAASFEKQGFSYLLPEEMVTDESLSNAVNEVFENREAYIQAMKSNTASNAIDIIVNLSDEAVKSRKKRKK